MSLMIGMAIEQGRLKLDATLGELGIDDNEPLTQAEKSATIRHLLQARSGIYLPSAFDTSSGRPLRGTFLPGENWFYNNWDFNVLGTILSLATGLSIAEAFGEMLAAPLAMQDYRPECIRLVHEPQSRHPVYRMFLSARDLARIGQMVLQGGVWNGRNIVPAQWIEASLIPHTEVVPGHHYGYLWWINDAGAKGDPLAIDLPMHFASGYGGQYVIIVPGLEWVIVHRAADVDNGISHARMGEIMQDIRKARL